MDFRYDLEYKSDDDQYQQISAKDLIFMHKNEQAILDANSRVFSGKLSLQHLMDFAEDYTEAIMNHELILIIARSFDSCYGSETAGGPAEIAIPKIE